MESIFGFFWRGSALGYWVAYEEIETGIVTPLCPLTSMGGHFSASFDKPGWGIVSQWFGKGGSTSNTAPETVWGNYEVYMVEMTKRILPPPKIWRLAKTHGYLGGTYLYANSPFAKINKSGTKVWFGSGWGTSYASGGQYDVYQINLPETWYEDLG
jgi:hypothetical protein